jgi:hypothetical protein
MITFNYSQDFTIQSSSMATIKTKITLVGSKTELPIECHADFSKIPPHLQDSYARAFLELFNKEFDLYGNLAQFIPSINGEISKEEPKMSKQAEKPKKKLLFLQNIKSWLTKN